MRVPGLAEEPDPGVSFSTKNSACSPSWSPPANFAWKKIQSAELYEVTCIFVPLRTYSSPSRRAVETIASTSEPAPSSVIA